jgi:hypothetical protein
MGFCQDRSPLTADSFQKAFGPGISSPQKSPHDSIYLWKKPRPSWPPAHDWSRHVSSAEPRRGDPPADRRRETAAWRHSPVRRLPEPLAHHGEPDIDQIRVPGLDRRAARPRPLFKWTPGCLPVRD